MGGYAANMEIIKEFFTKSPLKWSSKFNLEASFKNFKYKIYSENRLKKMIKMKHKSKISLMLILSVIMLLILVSDVSAYKRLCLSKGQVIPSKQNPMFKCTHTTCIVCVTAQNYPTHPNYCNDQAGCSIFGSEEDIIDNQPPVISITSPIGNKVYNNTKVLFDLKTNELAYIYYKDTSNSKNQWKPLSKKLTQSYKGEINFKDGLNNISIKAVDKKGNEKIVPVKFTIDSQTPKIKDVSPKKGFSEGNLSIKILESNPKSLKLFYGNSIKGMKTAAIALKNCTVNKESVTCNTKINLQDYNNQQISYYFLVEDIAGNKAQSKTATLDVDTVLPVINNPSSLISIEGKSASFNISVTEQNFLDVSYYDNSAKAPKWSKLCTSLKNGRCIKKISFSSGSHNIILKVTDKAGNFIIKQLNFKIN